MPRLADSNAHQLSEDSELQDLLRETVLLRGYDLGNKEVVELLKRLITDALPESLEQVTGQDEHETPQPPPLQHQLQSQSVHPQSQLCLLETITGRRCLWGWLWW